MSITTKKIQLYPLGDQEEVNRVFKYLRDGIYNQHLMLNVYMGELATLFYSVNMDTESELYKKGYNEIFSESNDMISKVEYKMLGNHINQLKEYTKELEKSYKDANKGFGSDEYKEKQKAIFRNTNKNIEFINQAKGLGMAGNCGMRVKKDFSTALKDGLARGERRLPYYKKNFPLIAPNRFLNFYITQEEYEADNGEMKERDIYAIKFVNKINFKVILGSRGKRDWYLTSLLDSIINDPEKYNVRDSSIQLTKDNKIILFLTVDIDKELEKYEPVIGKSMGLAMGYDKCLVAALSDDDKEYSIGDDIQESIVERRIAIQKKNQALQKALRNARGGHGRYRKVTRSQEKQKAYERNVVLKYNHVLSKKVVEFAKKNKVQTIIIEDISKEDLEKFPVLLRNWSYFQLETLITYKAEAEGIVVVKSKGKKEIRQGCCKCGCEIGKGHELPKEIEWCNELKFTCPSCGETLDYSYNKAKNIIVMG